MKKDALILKNGVVKTLAEWEEEASGKTEPAAEEPVEEVVKEVKKKGRKAKSK